MRERLHSLEDTLSPEFQRQFRAEQVRLYERDARARGLYSGADLLRQLADTIEAGTDDGLQCRYPIHGGGES